jgi:hypothetical protein
MGVGVKPEAQQRPLSEIAAEIKADWTKPYFGAEPYIEALATLDGIGDRYYAESAEGMVRYFLSNAFGWRGEVAKRVKAELKAMLA